MVHISVKETAMTLKNELLYRFTRQPGICFGENELASVCGVSPAEIRQAVSELQQDGYDIQSGAAGYCLMNTDDLRADMIMALSGDLQAPVYVFDEIDSTNNYARVLAGQNAEHGTLVCADHQTAGRGRQGHTFYSPKHDGLYFSLIIHPQKQDLIFRITPAAAVSAVEAIEEITGIHPEIKWVNDLFIEKKKVAGILTEAVNDRTDGTVKAVVIGIGINIRNVAFPEEIRNTAGSLGIENISRSALAASLRRHLLYHTAHLDDPALMDLYRRDSAVLGREITYTMNNEVYTGTAEAINDEGNIVIKKPDGSTLILQSGEISIKNW